MAQVKRIVFTAVDRVELQLQDQNLLPSDGEVAGPTLYSLVSSGTEVTGLLSGNLAGVKYPAFPGYAAVFRVEAVGAGVTSLVPGDLALCMGRHQSYQCINENAAVKLPEGLPADIAPMSRLMNVSMTTLVTTAARPGDTVVVTGLGPVGLLAALMFKRSGYRVVGVDPIEWRRELASNRGLHEVLPTIEGEVYKGEAPSLAVECSGSEAATLAAVKIVRELGEVVLVGVPWKKTTDEPAFGLLYDIFHRYITVRSGWEWELPRHSSHFAQAHTIFGNIALGMEWLLQWFSADAMNLRGLFEVISADQAPQVYGDIAAGRRTSLMSVFDWR